MGADTVQMSCMWVASCLLFSPYCSYWMVLMEISEFDYAIMAGVIDNQIVHPPLPSFNPLIFTATYRDA